SVGSHGYGNASVGWFNGRVVDVAHRVSYQAFKGEIPRGFEIDHKCRCRSCVNPDHLEAVPKRVNVRRQFDLQSQDFTKCAYGHREYFRARNGKMVCTTCKAKSHALNAGRRAASAAHA
ncbi:MAG: HNH endonuclease signature motif containing protein, partial [Verrucomicrobiaceae bacterium]